MPVVGGRSIAVIPEAAAAPRPTEAFAFLAVVLQRERRQPGTLVPAVGQTDDGGQALLLRFVLVEVAKARAHRAVLNKGELLAAAVTVAAQAPPP